MPVCGLSQRASTRNARRTRPSATLDGSSLGRYCGSVDFAGLSKSALRVGEDASLRAASWAGEQVDELKGRGPFFQAKLALAVGYGVIALLTLLLVAPAHADWQVNQQRISFGMTFRTAVVVKNNDGGDLNAARVEVRGHGIEFDGKEVPGVWRSKKLDLPEGGQAKLVSEQLFDKDNRSPPYAFVATEVVVFDDDGDERVTLPVAPVLGN